MKVLLVSEGAHELGDGNADTSALAILCGRLLGGKAAFDLRPFSSVEVKVHMARGKGSKLTHRMLAWVRKAQRDGYDAMIAVVDQDDDVQRRQQVAAAQEDARITFRRACGLAIQTFDAWMLADETALAKALAMPVQRQPDPETQRDPKGLCTALLDGSTCGLAPRQMYAMIAGVCRPPVLEQRCPLGFGVFAQRVRALR